MGNNKTPEECFTLHDGMKRKYKSYQNIIDTLPKILKIGSN